MKTLVSIAFLTFAISTTTGIDAAPWALMCKGPFSGTLNAKYIAIGDSGFTIEFVKAPQKAGHTFADLKAGQCAWADRTVSRTEPGCVGFDGTDLINFDVTWQINSNGSLTPMIPSSASNPLKHWISTKGNIIFFVHGDGRTKSTGCFKIAHEGSSLQVEPK